MLGQLGFTTKAVTATTLATQLTSDVDVLVVGATLNPATLNAANKPAYDAFIARGGGVVGLGTAGSAHTTNAGPADRDRPGRRQPHLRRRQRRQQRRPDRQRRRVDRVDLPARVVLEPRLQRRRRADVRHRPAVVGLVAAWPAPRARPTPPARPASSGRQRQRQRRRPDRHERRHPPARQGSVGAVRPRDPVRGRAERRRRVDLHRRHRRRHRAGDALADAGRARHVRRVRPGRGERLHGRPPRPTSSPPPVTRPCRSRRPRRS